MGDWVTDSSLVDHHSTKLLEVFSTLKSPVFSELVIVLGGHGVAASNWGDEGTLFKALRKMNELMPFKLVFLLEGPFFGKEGMARLVVAEALELATGQGFLDFLDSPPTVR